MNELQKSKVIEKRPDHLIIKLKADSFCDEGVECFIEGKNEKAILMFNKSLQVFPKDPRAYYKRGEAFTRLGDKQKALADFNKAIRLDPKNPNAFGSRGELYLGKKDFDRALKDFNQAIKIVPEFPSFYVSRGKAYFIMGKLADAVKDFLRALKLDPKNERYSGAEACLYLAMIRFKKGDRKRAKEFFTRAVKLDSLLVLTEEVWQFAKDGLFPALEYLYKTVKEARK